YLVKKYQNYVELTLIGSLYDNKTLHEELKSHNYLGTMSHPLVLEQMHMHDVLLFPSLFDGFGMVMSEAMSQGTPVIASDRCAGPDIIRHGENGWLMQAGNTESLEQVVLSIIQNREQIKDVSYGATYTAMKRPWESYAAELTNTIRMHL